MCPKVMCHLPYHIFDLDCGLHKLLLHGLFMALLESIACEMVELAGLIADMWGSLYAAAVAGVYPSDT